MEIVGVRRFVLAGGLEMVDWKSIAARMFACSLLVVSLGGVFSAVPARAVPAVDLQLVATVADQVVYVANSGVAGDDRLFIVRKRGVVHIFDGSTLLATPFLDIDALVVNPFGLGDERGLLSMAFHPDYGSNGFFYVNYINNSGNTVIARYQVSGDPDVANSASAHLILGIAQPAGNHNGGQLQFGPDGYLYVAMGDGGGGCDSAGSGCNAQKTNSLLGAMLRIDVDTDDFPGDPDRNYGIPADNPFVGDAAVVDETWAYGLRNPWRFSFDRSTGDLWMGDVGQSGATRREEVNFQASGVGGQNYGWPIAEGNQCGPGTCSLTNCPTPIPSCGSLTFPVYEYTGSPSCAVTGGFVYRGSAISGLAGRYVFGDYCSGDIIALNPADTSDDPQIADTGFGLTSFGEDVAGELYAAVGSSVYKLVAAGGPTPTPTPVSTPTQTPVGVSCPATPAAGCRSAEKGILKIKDDSDPSKDLVLWKWLKGAATTQAELGADPVTGGTSYAACLYDQAAGVPSLAIEMRVDRSGDACAGRPCFKSIGGQPPVGKGWRYMDRDMSSDGVRRMVLKGGVARRAKIVFQAKGAALSLPAPFSGEQLLAQDGNVIIQLVSSDGGACFETVLPEPAKKNAADLFRDKF